MIKNLEGDQWNSKKDLKTRNHDKISVNVPKRPSDQSSLIFVFHKDWNLVINMMIGIHKSIRAQYRVRNPVIDVRDYKARDVFELSYKRSIEDYGKYRGKCFFFNYAPYIFSEIRRIYNIENEEYLSSIGSETLITNLMKGELSS
jgi:1-phosphatidylinositol-4-phosphate 5-kinase